MKFDDFSKFEKNFLNGKLSVYTDKYVRLNIVWSPEQLTIDFLAHIQNELLVDTIYLKNYNDNRRPGFNPVRSMEWLNGIDGYKWVLGKAKKKYEKDKDVAVQGSPIIERIRFGDWSEKKVFDINYGLKGPNGHNRISTQDFRNLGYEPWTIKHVNEQLKDKYKLDLKQILYTLPLNNYLVDITDYWLENYYQDENNPALIPLVKTFRSPFYYFTYQAAYYASYESLGELRFSPGSESHQYSFGFAVINFKRQKGALFDIKEFTKDEQPLKTIISALAKNEGVDYHDYKPELIKSDLAAFFKTYLTYFNPS